MQGRLKKPLRREGFTLLELAIVLVVIGLIVGGIMVGQTLIRSAQIARAISEFSRYTAAVNTFYGKYRGLPGDIVDAEVYWGSDAGCPATTLNTVPKTATCNGDGNGKIGTHQAGSNCREMWRAWQQLADAGLVAGIFSGVAAGDGSGTGCLPQPTISMPGSVIENGAWIILSYNPNAPALWSNSYFPGYYGNGFAFGNFPSNQISPILRPNEAFMIDTKLDDGNPAKGTIVSPGTDYTPNCVTSSNPVTAQYALTTTSVSCALFFRNAF